jgi:hypothetical protein
MASADRLASEEAEVVVLAATVPLFRRVEELAEKMGHTRAVLRWGGLRGCCREEPD